MVSKPMVPCYGCQDRSATCHGSCEKYKEYAAEMEKIREDRRKKAEAKDAYFDILNSRKAKKDRKILSGKSQKDHWRYK